MALRNYIYLMLLTLAVGQPMAVVAQPLTESVDALEALFGKHAGVRRTRTKGLCAKGFFIGTAEARAPVSYTHLTLPTILLV